MRFLVGVVLVLALGCGDCGEGTGGGGTGGGSSSVCSKTANCGCSNFKKAECGGLCCRWVVGTGCLCR